MLRAGLERFLEELELDDGLDDLDIDAEAALLGLSDEEIEGERSPNEEQELEYVDEDGNPVAIGENNADQYEVANIESDKLSNPADEDVLELDLDTELDSFNQETSDLLRESPIPSKSYKERQRKENLISLTSRNEQDRTIARCKEPSYSPEGDQEKANKDVSFPNQTHVLTMDHRDSYGGDELEYDEESEDENADDHRERFKSERSNIITLTPAKRRTDIPDTLESVLCVEETARVQAYLDDMQRKKHHRKPHGRQKPAFSRPPPRNFSTTQVQQPSQYSSANTTCTSQAVPAPRRKILINPHFTGIRLPPSSDSVHVMPETHQAAAAPPTSYDTSNFPPPVYSHHQEPAHPVSLAPPPIYTAPPPTVQYKHPEYPPQQPMQQIPPPAWQPPDMTVPSYSMPPPIMNYGDPASQPPSYNYNQNYQNNNYQNPPMQMPQTVNYSQPPPPVNLYTPSFPTQNINPVSSSMTHTPYSPAPNQVRMQHMNVQPQSYQEAPVTSQQPQMTSHMQRPRFNPNQRNARPPERRASNLNIKHVPLKQPRLEHPPRKMNVHVNNSNIREIPLVDTLPSSRKTSANKTVPIVEDEDEKTKELRMKIEEQKLLREQILKRKEERRRQMAAQRKLELKERQAEQSKNTVTIIPKAMNQNNQVKTVATVKPVPKPSVKERIGLPLNKNLTATKKKIVVVRKKATQNIVTATQDNSKAPPIIGQRLKLPVPSQQNNQQIIRPAAAVTPQQNTSNKQTSKDSGDFNKPVNPVKNTENKSPGNAPIRKAQPTVSPKKIHLNSQAQRGKGGHLGRPNFQRPPFSQMQRLHRPRIPGPRGAQFPPSPFREPRMHFPNRGPPMNEMRMPPPHFHDPRPPLLPFHPPEHGPFNQFMSPEISFEPKSPPFRMRGPGMANFRPRGMEPPMFHDRFPPPQFANQMPQMRRGFDNNMSRFHRPRFQPQGKQKFASNNNVNQKPTTKEPQVAGSQEQKTNQKSSGTTGKCNESAPKVFVTRNQPKNVTEDKDIPKTQSVSIENLSSSTNEAQLRKLCSSVGVVENIQLLKSERKAVIKFKEPRQALNFQKKYQRYMLDLAMIQVSLLSA